MLLNLELSNFQKHEHLKLDFASGTTIITGKNWAGKSTVHRAILFGLFGPAVVPGGSKILQRRGTNKKPKVEVSFTVANRVYHVSRSPSTVVLKEDGERLATGATQVSTKIEEVLGMSGRLFVDLRTAPQEEAAAILTLGSHKLAKLLNTVTQVDVVDRVLELCSQETTELGVYLKMGDDVKVDEARELVSDLKTKLFKQYEQLSIEKEKHTKVEGRRNIAYGLHKDLKQKQEAHRAQEQERLRLEGGLRTMESTLDARKQEISQLTPTSEADIDKCRQVYSKLENEQRQEEVAVNSYTDTKQRLSQSVRSLESDLYERRTKVENTSALIEKLVEHSPQHISQMEETETKLKYEVHRLTEKLNELVKARDSSICPTCNRPYDLDSHSLANLLKEIKQVEDTLHQAEQGIRDIESPLIGAKESLAASDSLREDHKQLTGEISLLEDQKQKAQEVWQQLTEPKKTVGLEQKVAKALKAYHATYAAGEAWNGAEARVRHAQIQIKHQLASLKKLKESTPESVDQAELDKTLEEYEQLTKEFNTVNLQLTQINTMYSENYAVCIREEKRMRELEEQEKKIKAKRERAIQIKRLSGYLRKNRDAFTHKVWSSILQYASQFVNIATSGKVLEISRDKDGTFTYLEDGYTMPAAAASGLQKAIIGTGIRLALAEAVAAPVRFFLFDEVTAGAADEASLAVTQALAQTGAQIVAVTHRPMDAAVADKTISL